MIATADEGDRRNLCDVHSAISGSPDDLAVIQSIAMKKTDPIRQHISNLLTKAEAHIDLREALKNFPKDLRGTQA